jgi:hypothetical protein
MGGTIHSNRSLELPELDVEAEMPDDREKISNGPNEEAINETIAGTGPGIPDDALAPDEDLPEAPTDEQVERAAEALDAPVARKERDTLPLDGE